MPLHNTVRENFLKGDGGELNASKLKKPKMHALHSSSALGVNVFQYWMDKEDLSPILQACNLCNQGNIIKGEISFERKLPINSIFRFPPNIDVFIETEEHPNCKAYAIECKFSEAYGSYKSSGLKEKYLNLDNSIWKDIPNIYNLAQQICPNDDKFRYLHPAQLIKHILGLKIKYPKSKFRLLYLWYNVLGEEGYSHEQEISKFLRIAKKDKIQFHAISYQKLFVNLRNYY